MKQIREFTNAYIIWDGEDGDHLEIPNVFETSATKVFTELHYEEAGEEKTVWFRTSKIYAIYFEVVEGLCEVER
jgi:hypothetical protein